MYSHFFTWANGEHAPLTSVIQHKWSFLPHGVEDGDLIEIDWKKRRNYRRVSSLSCRMCTMQTATFTGIIRQKKLFSRISANGSVTLQFAPASDVARVGPNYRILERHIAVSRRSSDGLCRFRSPVGYALGQWLFQLLLQSNDTCRTVNNERRPTQWKAAVNQMNCSSNSSSSTRQVSFIRSSTRIAVYQSTSWYIRLFCERVSQARKLRLKLRGAYDTIHITKNSPNGVESLPSRNRVATVICTWCIQTFN